MSLSHDGTGGATGVPVESQGGRAGVKIGKENPSAGQLVIEGGVSLNGSVKISGAKNAALPVMAAALLTNEECVIDNVPDIEDVRTMGEVLESLGANIRFEDKNRVIIKADGIDRWHAPEDLVQKMRASFLVMGPLLARFGMAEATQPGGCAIGTRPVNVDVKGFANMGAQIVREEGLYVAKSPRLTGARIYLDYPSHTGTENLLMAAALAKGRTTIIHASAEPEVVALAECLVKMGARISGAGSSLIEVEGVERLHGVYHKIIPDRIEAGTFAIAAAITSGSILLDGVIPAHLYPVTNKLLELGVEVEENWDAIVVKRTKPLFSVEVQALPYPGFPTDLQSAICPLLTQANGMSTIHERVYDNRLQYAGELEKMGASISVSGQMAEILGPATLRGAEVKALDIRCGAALVIAGLAAEGATVINDVYHIERGYEGLDSKLSELGAKIKMR